MDDFKEIKKLLKQNLEISQESSTILKKIRRNQKISRFFMVFKWVIIIALALGAYYYIQPLMETFFEAAGQIREDFSVLRQTGSGVGDLPPSVLDKLQTFFEN